MPMLTTVMVDKLAFQFSLDGSISPQIKISPPIEIIYKNKSALLTHLRIPRNNNQTLSDRELELASGDVINVTLNSTGIGDAYLLEDIHILSKGAGPRYRVLPEFCPACGLATLGGEDPSDRICLNRACSAQVNNNLTLFTASIGLIFSNHIRQIFMHLILRGAVRSPADLFKTTLTDLKNLNISEIRATEYIHYIHSVRGTVSIGQMLRGLRVPLLTDEHIVAIQTTMNKHGLNLATWENIRELKTKSQDLVDALAILDTGFLDIANNRQILTELCQYLWR